jgi:hypothetical protein
MSRIHSLPIVEKDELDNKVVLDLKDKPDPNDPNDYEGDFFELKDSYKTLYIRYDDIVGDDIELTGELYDDKNPPISKGKLTKEIIKTFDYGETKNVYIQISKPNYFGGHCHMTKYNGKLRKETMDGRDFYTLINKNENYIGDFFEFVDVCKVNGIPNKPFYYPYNTVISGFRTGNLYSKDDPRIILTDNLKRYIESFDLGEINKIDIILVVNTRVYSKKNIIEGTFYITKYYGKLDINIDENGNKIYTPIEKTDSNIIKVCDKLGKCFTRRRGGSKKRFKKTRKQRKHRKSKRNHKK